MDQYGENRDEMLRAAARQLPGSEGLGEIRWKGRSSDYRERMDVRMRSLHHTQQLGGAEANRAYTPQIHYKPNWQIDQLIKDALVFEYGDKLVPTAEQKANTAIGNAVIREMSDRSHAVQSLQSEVDCLRAEITELHNNNRMDRQQYERETTAYKTALADSQRDLNDLRRALSDVHDIVVGDDCDRVPYPELPLVLASRIIDKEDHGAFDRAYAYVHNRAKNVDAQDVAQEEIRVGDVVKRPTRRG